MPTWIENGCEDFNGITATSPGATVNDLITSMGWTQNSTSNIYSMDGPYSGNRAIRWNSNNRTIYKPWGSNYSEFYINFHFQALTLPAGNAIFLYFYDNATIQVGMYLSSGGDLGVTLGSTSVASAATGIVAGRWYFIQAKVIIHNSTGVFTVRLNNSQVINYSGDTQVSANAYATTTLMGNPNVGTASFAFANIFMYSDSASWPLSECHYKRVAPDAAGNYSQFTPLASTNVSQIDEQQSDSDTTYNSSTSIGNKDSFGTDANIGSGESILGVIEENWSKKTDAGARDLRTLLRISSTDYESSSISLTASYVRYRNFRNTDPSTSSAWLYSAINAMEIGYKDQA